MMLRQDQYQKTKVTVQRISEKTGIPVKSLLDILGWSDPTIQFNGGHLNSGELKFVAKEYVRAVKDLQKRTNSKRDRMPVSELKEVRNFLFRFVSWESRFEINADSLRARLEDQKIEAFFYDLVFGCQQKSSHAEFIHIHHQLRFKKPIVKAFSLFRATESFRTFHHQVYPDEEGESISCNYSRTPL